MTSEEQKISCNLLNLLDYFERALKTPLPPGPKQKQFKSPNPLADGIPKDRQNSNDFRTKTPKPKAQRQRSETA